MLQNRLRELRARYRLTQSDLGAKAGVTRQTIGFIEKGDYEPSITLALKIAEALDHTVEEVFWLDNSNNKR
ncbi:helix-turn-helix transcriptional regulator [Bacillus manliponensis]|uniref:helix-turn-helix transcriptional regulator n=1 Tax=Bacillus manliponensis TaxID=574376 RepID=UPI00351838AE